MEEELLGHRHQPLLVPILYESDEEMLQSRTVREIQIASNFAVLKSSARNDSFPSTSKRLKTAATTTIEKSAQQQQQYELAVETAILVQKEIEQWENSIRELEHMLNHQDEPQPLPQHYRFQSTQGAVHVAADALPIADDTNTAVQQYHHHHHNVPSILPNRSVSVSSTESKVVLMDKDGDVGVVVAEEEEDVPHATIPVTTTWEEVASSTSSSPSLPAVEIVTVSFSST